MIEQKAALLAVYSVLLLVACILPFSLQLRAYRYPSAWTIDRVYGAALAVVGLALLVARPWPGLTSPLVLSIAFAAPLVFSGAGYAIGGLLALPLVGAATWWDPSLRLDAARAAIFLVVGISAVALPRLLPRAEGAPPLPSLLAIFVLGVAAVSLTGFMGSPQGFGTVWHHWSVYVGSSQALLGGAIPFQDYPVQYGMGPTLLIAALCGQECWSGTYIVAAATNLLYLLAMAGSVVLLTRKLPMGLALVPLAAMACAILMWTGYPPDFKGPIATPSVDGLRFFPLATLLCFIIAAEERGFRLDAAGHALWLLGIVWSPEAAFYATIVWWPYLALRRAQDLGATSVAGVTIEVLRGAGVALAATVAAFAALATLFRVVYHQWPSIEGFTAYVRDPPGILPVNPTGPIWLALAAAGVVAVAQLRADARGIRLGFVSLMGLFAAGSYYLGRSHDNNVLNLLPFVVLALTAALGIGLKDVASGFVQVTLASLVALLATFGFEILERSGPERRSLEYRAEPFHQRHTPGHRGIFRACRPKPRGSPEDACACADSGCSRRAGMAARARGGVAGVGVPVNVSALRTSGAGLDRNERRRRLRPSPARRGRDLHTQRRAAPAPARLDPGRPRADDALASALLRQLFDH